MPRQLPKEIKSLNLFSNQSSKKTCKFVLQQRDQRFVSWSLCFNFPVFGKVGDPVPARYFLDAIIFY